MTIPTWRGEHAIETFASPRMVWRLLADVPGWPRWNHGIARIEVKGAFAEGGVFEMTLPTDETLTSRLLRVVPERAFTDETRLGALVVRVVHRIESGRKLPTRIVYAVEAEGPGAEEIGPAVSADFPEVLARLARLAEAATPPHG